MAFGSSKKLEGHDLDEAPDLVVEINITPLTDVFLVLLIIFMVTSSVLSQMGVDVNLPKASQGSQQSKPEGVIVTLLPSGDLKVNSLAIRAGAYEELMQAIKNAFQLSESRLVILEGDQKAFLGSVISVMDYAKKAGAERFAIATQPEGTR